MNDYDPVPADVRGAYNKFVEAAQAKGFKVGHAFLHTKDVLKEGDDVKVELASLGTAESRFWPCRGYADNITVVGKLPQSKND
tara:strand:+ start:2879 stop:3127 length:249 start_codon:yes stop_codon:yes gene_type:complete